MTILAKWTDTSVSLIYPPTDKQKPKLLSKIFTVYPERSENVFYVKTLVTLNNEPVNKTKYNLLISTHLCVLQT